MSDLQTLYQGRPNIRYPQPPLPPTVHPDNPASGIFGGLADLLKYAGADEMAMSALGAPDWKRALDYMQVEQNGQLR